LKTAAAEVAKDPVPSTVLEIVSEDPDKPLACISAPAAQALISVNRFEAIVDVLLLET
jgi:hypothetical protein